MDQSTEIGMVKKKPPKNINVDMGRPLSKISSHAPVKNIGEWVRRPREKRLQERHLRFGHTPRPMNAFLLYRFAYLERAQEWCRQNKQQVLSRIVAISWYMESTTLRRLFQDYAKTEKDNHGKAYAPYHYSPRRRRQGSSARSKKIATHADYYGPTSLEWKSSLDTLCHSMSWDDTAFKTSDIKQSMLLPSAFPYQQVSHPPPAGNLFVVANKNTPWDTERIPQYHIASDTRSHIILAEDLPLYSVSERTIFDQYSDIKPTSLTRDLPVEPYWLEYRQNPFSNSSKLDF